MRISHYFHLVALISLSIALVMVGESSPTVHPAAWILLVLCIVGFITGWILEQPYEL